MNSMRSTREDGTLIEQEGGSDLGKHELDPAGNSVGFSDPYTVSYPDPFPYFFQPFESFCSLVNGQFQSYSVDGIQVPRSYFSDQIDLAFGGIFGLVEHQARMSIMFAGYSLKFRNGDEQFAGYDLDAAIAKMEGGEQLNRNWFVSDSSWALNNLIQTELQERTLFPWNPLVEKRQFDDAEVGTLRSKVQEMLEANDGECKRYVERLLDKANELFPNGEEGLIKRSENVLKTHMVMDIFSLVSEEGGFYYAFGNTSSGFKNKPEFNGSRVWLFGGNGIDPRTRSLSALWLKYSSALDSLATVTTIHELLHYNFTDNQLAMAATVLNQETPNLGGFFGTSEYWGNDLRLHCDPTYVKPTKPTMNR